MVLLPGAEHVSSTVNDFRLDLDRPERSKKGGKALLKLWITMLDEDNISGCCWVNYWYCNDDKLYMFGIILFC